MTATRKLAAAGLVYYVHSMFFSNQADAMDDAMFLVQPYLAKATGLVALPAQAFADAASARRAGWRLARYKAGVVVLSQSVDLLAARRGRPAVLAIHGHVPESWGALARAA